MSAWIYGVAYLGGVVTGGWIIGLLAMKKIAAANARYAWLRYRCEQLGYLIPDDTRDDTT